jgi:tripartite-type tricarboxylate transporter receptor subunit TctC
MKGPRSSFAWLLFQVCMVNTIPNPAMAQQDYPKRPIKMIVSASPGGTTDLLARAVGERLTETLKQPVIVENRSSALGVIAAEATMAAAPDGYTLLATWHTHTISAAMNPNASYHAVNSFTPITQFTSAGLMLVVHPSAPARNLREFVDWTKNSATPLNFGSAGNGSGGHLAGELYKMMLGVKAQHIPYKGTGPAMTDLLAGRYDFAFGAPQGASINMVRAGRLRAIAVTTSARLSAWPEIPAMAEVLPGFEVLSWYGLLGPAKLPPPVVTRLYEEVRKALQHPSVRERILADGAVPVGNSPEEFRRFLQADLNKWSRLVKQTGAKLD